MNKEINFSTPSKSELLERNDKTERMYRLIDNNATDEELINADYALRLLEERIYNRYNKRQVYNRPVKDIRKCY